MLILAGGVAVGLGGAQSIRGLPERVISGDSGLQGNLEVWSPPVAENTRFLVFYDFGKIRNHNNPLLTSATLTSVGAGVRWGLGSRWSASLDFAHVLSGDANLPLGTSRDRAHFNLTWRY